MQHVFQDYQLLSASIKENIVLNSDECDSEKLDALLENLKIKNKINSLFCGVDTMLYRDFDANGYTPSGGEAQKIAIARSAWRNADFLILDEPTAALDPKAEHELYEMFDKLFCKKTCMYITHRLSSI